MKIVFSDSLELWVGMLVLEGYLHVSNIFFSQSLFVI